MYYYNYYVFNVLNTKLPTELMFTVYHHTDVNKDYVILDDKHGYKSSTESPHVQACTTVDVLDCTSSAQVSLSQISWLPLPSPPHPSPPLPLSPPPPPQT